MESYGASSVLFVGQAGTVCDAEMREIFGISLNVVVVPLDS